jgi:hypothetical protein
VRADGLAEAVGEGVSRVCREEVDSIIALSAVEQSEGGGAGCGGFSDSPFPGEEKDTLLKNLGWIVQWPACSVFPGHVALEES